MAGNFPSAEWCGEVFHKLGVHYVESLILVDALFPLDGGRRREEKKKKSPWREEGFPWAGPTLLGMSQVAAIRSN
jgi:hypothetical protein